MWGGAGWFTFKETHWFGGQKQHEQEPTQSDREQEGGEDVAQFKYKKSKDGELDGNGEVDLPQTEFAKAGPEEVEVNVPSS